MLPYIGMTLNATEENCQPARPPVVPFHDESGTAAESHPSVFICDGVQPDCRTLRVSETRYNYCVETVITHQRQWHFSNKATIKHYRL